MCVIQIIEVLPGIVNGNSIETITVNGTARNCVVTEHNVNYIHLHARGTVIETVQTIEGYVKLEIPNDVSVDEEIEWEITVTELKMQLIPCGSHVEITVACMADRECNDSTSKVLTCENDCPNVTLTVTNTEPCDNGQQLISFAINVNAAPNPTILEIDYGDGTSDNIPNSEIVENAGNPISRSHLYDSGSYEVIVDTIHPEGCGSSNVEPVDVECDPIDPNGNDCPNITLTVTNREPCDNGQELVSFAINVNDAPNPTVLEIKYGDGTSDNILDEEIAGNPISRSHLYDSGSYEVIVDTIHPGGCGSSNEVSVDVECDPVCPDDVEFEILGANGNRFKISDSISGQYEQINDNSSEDQIDCLPSGDYTIRVVEPSGGGVVSITWREDDNPPITTNQVNFNVHLNSGDEKTINVTISKQNCPPLSESVVIRACGCEETDWSEWSECEDCTQTRTRTLSDCSQETETRPCTMTPTNWSPWSTGLCIQTRSRLDENCQTQQQSRIDWCCVWMVINIGLSAVTAILILITLCMLPATFWSAVGALASGGALAAVWAALAATNIVMIIISAVLLIVSLLSFILWLIFCVFKNVRNIACTLLSNFITVMAWLTTISVLVFFVTIALALIGFFGCAVGAFIDIAWFGTILAVASLVRKYLCED